jgi:oligopeptide transport system substrate-binding protein
MELNRRRMLGCAGAGLALAASLAKDGPAAALAAPMPQMAGSRTLRLPLTSDPETIDPHKVSFTNEIEIAMRVFRNLLKYDANNSIVPDLAEAMPEVSEDGKVLTFTIKEGATWSDGKPLVATDFVYGWQRQLDPAVGGEYAFLGYQIEGAEAYHTADMRTPARLQVLRDSVGVKAVGARVVRLRLREPAAWFVNVLTTWVGVPVREELVRQGNGGDDYQDKWTVPATYVGPGPFIMTERERHNRISFVANPRYTPTSLIESVEYNLIGDQTVLFAAYLNDELDTMTYIHEDKARVDRDPVLKSQSYEYPEPTTYRIDFNTRRPPFDNQKLRLAFSHAVDRVSFVRDLLGGAGIPARQLVPPGNPGHYEAGIEEQSFNPMAARRLLAEAGYRDGRGLPEIKWTYAASPRSKARVEAVIAQLRQYLGVTVLADPVGSSTLSTLIRQLDTTPQMFLLGWHHDYPDPQNWYSAVFHSASSNNRTGWVNPLFDRYTEAADRELDTAMRHEWYRQAAQVLLNDAPSIMLWHAFSWRLVKPRVRGWDVEATANEAFRGERSIETMHLD